ncbi:MAG: hypothetical protein ACM3N3_02650 [Betaproteobacteria bacterium]
MAESISGELSVKGNITCAICYGRWTIFWAARSINYTRRTMLSDALESGTRNLQG